MPEIPLHSEDLPQEEKRETGVSRLVGFSPEEEKEVLKQAENIFKDQSNKKILESDIKLFEREKTPEEIEMINDILSKMPEFVSKYGADLPPVIADHIHILDEKNLTKEAREEKAKNPENGGYVPAQQFAYIFDTGSPLKNAGAIVHELLHFSSFNSFEKNTKLGKREAKIRRTGFEIHDNSGDGKEVYFLDFNEAIIEELAKRFDKEYFSSIPPLKKEVQDRQEFIDKHRGGKQGDVSFVQIKQAEAGTLDWQIEPYAYSKYRKQLRDMIKNIYEKNKGSFKSREEIFNVFASSAMSGKLLASARLIEKTYGKHSFRETKKALGRGSFRELGENTKREIK